PRLPPPRTGVVDVIVVRFLRLSIIAVEGGANSMLPIYKVRASRSDAIRRLFNIRFVCGIDRDLIFRLNFIDFITVVSTRVAGRSGISGEPGREGKRHKDSWPHG